MSKQVIPFLSAREINHVEDYTRFYHTSACISQCSQRIPAQRKINPALKELMEACGYGRYERFYQHRTEWDLLERNIPRSYLAAIGADEETIRFTLKLDREEFKHVLQCRFYPRYGSARLGPCVYIDISFPPDTPEEEAIAMLQQWNADKNRHCWINYPNVKTIIIGKDNSVASTGYPPQARFTRKWLMVTADGRRIGAVTLK